MRNLNETFQNQYVLQPCFCDWMIFFQAYKIGRDQIVTKNLLGKIVYMIITSTNFEKVSHADWFTFVEFLRASWLRSLEVMHPPQFLSPDS